MGEHPSRGSYFRRLHTSRGGHHSSNEPVSLLQPQEHPPAAHSLEGEGDVPTYQSFSLFSAFSSSGDFGGILTSSPVHSPSPDHANLLHQRNALSPAERRDGGFSNIGDTTPQFHEKVSEQHERKEADRGESTNSPSAAQFSALLTQNLRLESSVRQLQEHVIHLLHATERLNYDHSLIVHQMQHSWQYNYAQMQNQGQGFIYSSPVHRSPPGNDNESMSNKHHKHPQQLSTASHPSLTAMAGTGQPGESRFATETEMRDEIRQLKERLCTVEGRHKVVQGKVSQLDKLYGTSAASWGRHIKNQLHDMSPQLHPRRRDDFSTYVSPGGDEDVNSTTVSEVSTKQSSHIQCSENDSPIPTCSTSCSGVEDCCIACGGVMLRARDMQDIS